MQRIDDFKKGKLVEVCVPRANSPDSMFAHEDCGMRVVDEIPCQVGKLFDDLRSDFRVSVGGDEDTEPR